MNQLRLTFVTAIAVVLASITSAMAQDAIAEIETWRGVVVRIAQPSLDVLYTIAPAPLLGSTGAPIAGAPGTQAPAQTAATMGTSRSVAAATVGAGPQPIQAR